LRNLPFIIALLILASAPLRVDGAGPVFFIQPTNQTVLAGSFFSFTARASSSASPSYQWFFNGAPLAGRVSDFLSLGPAEPAHQGFYYATASNSSGISLSHTAALTVISYPVGIAVQPTNTSATVGQFVIISLVATGAPPPIYHWQRDGIDIGSGGPAVHLNNVQETHAGDYRVIVLNSVNSVTSDVARLTVSPYPFISSHPTNTTAYVGQELTFRTTVYGQPPLFLQWHFNSQPIPGATNAHLNIPEVGHTDSGPYFLAVSNVLGAVTSQVAVVSVVPPPESPGSLDATFRSGDTARQAVDAIALRPDGRILAAGIFSPSDGIRVRQLLPDGAIDSAFDSSRTFSNTVRALVIQSDGTILVGADFAPASSQPRQNITKLASNGTVEAVFNLPAQLWYIHTIVVQPSGRIIYGGYNNGYGATYLAALSAAGVADSGFESAIIPFPRDGVVSPNDNTVFALRSQWDGKLMSAQTYGNGRRHPDGSRDASYERNFNSDLLELTGDDKCVLGNTRLVLNSSQRSLLVRTLADGRQDPAFLPDPLFTNRVGSISRITVQSDGKIIVSGVLSAQPSRSLLVRLQSDGRLDTNFAELTFGGQVSSLLITPDCKLLVSGTFTNLAGFKRSGIARIHLDPAGVPQIIQQPSSLSLRPGQAGILRVQATCSPSTLVQWYFSDTPLSGATNSLLIFTNAQLSHHGVYHVVLSNSFGSVTSELASISIDLSPPPAGSIEVSFLPNQGCNNAARALLKTADGKIVVAGSFTEVNGVPQVHVARLNRDGSLDPDFNAGSGAGGRVLCLAGAPEGKIYVGGSFTNFGGFHTRGVVRLNPDGTVDTTFNANIGPTSSNEVRCLAMHRGGKLLVGGGFVGVGTNQTQRHLVRLLADGTLDESFRPPWLPSQLYEATVNCLAVTPEQTVVVGGNFLLGSQRYEMLRLREDGSGERYFSTQNNREIRAIALQTDGKAVAARSDNRIVRYLPDALLDPAFNADLTNLSTAFISSLHVEPCGRIVAAGLVSASGLQPRPWGNLMRFNPDGSRDSEFMPPITDGRIWSAAALDDGTIALVGEFSYVDGASRRCVALVRGGPYFSPTITSQPVSQTIGEGQHLELSVGTPCTIPPVFVSWTLNGTNVPNETNAFMQLRHVSRFQSGLYSAIVSNAVGVLTSVTAHVLINNAPRVPGAPNIERTSFLPTNTLVHSLVALPGGKLLVGGSIPKLADRDGLVRLNPDGTRDETFTFITTNIVRNLAVYEDRRIIVIEQQLNRISVRRLMPNGVKDTTFGFSPDYAYNWFDDTRPSIPVAVGPNGEPCWAQNRKFIKFGSWNKNVYGGIHAFAFQTDGKIVLGGAFSAIGGDGFGANGVPCTNLVRLMTNGLVDPGFFPEAGVIYALALQPDGKVIAGGQFSRAGPFIRRCVARFNVDGSIDQTFAPSPGVLGTDAAVRAIILQLDGRIVIGGTFTHYNGISRNGLARLTADGSLDETFDPSHGISGGMPPQIHALAVGLDGTLYLGGSFTHFNNIPRHGLAAAYNNPLIYGTQLVDGALSVSFLSLLDRTYRLESTPGLDEQAWTTVSGLSGDGTLRVLLDTNATGGARLYRIRVE
jgi:uncharacterized delta-60 repeat protein